MRRLPPRSTRTATPFPYTTLFRSLASEATGLLELIARNTDGASKDPELLLLAGASHLMQNDLARARDAIGSRILDGDAESELWRAALADRKSTRLNSSH